MNWTLVGYFPKHRTTRSGFVSPYPDYPNAAFPAPLPVEEICSVSECISHGPKDWIQHWTHNDMWLYSTQVAAWAVVSEAERSQFELHAYRILHVLFEDGERRSFELPQLQVSMAGTSEPVEPLSTEFAPLGFDAVSLDSPGFGTFQFGHSPLSCNGMAEVIETNEHCLLANLAMAQAIALRFSIERPEPGPYVVVEVLRGLGWVEWSRKACK